MKKIVFILTVIVLFFVSGLGLEAQCPKDNQITKLTSNMEAFKAVQPLVFSKVVSAGAYAKKDGTKLQVCMSNADFPIDKMANDFVVPITEKSQWIAVLNFSNARNPIVAGKYTAAAGYGKPFWVYAEVKVNYGEKNTIVSLGVVEGTAEIVEITDTHVCGTFNLKNAKGDSSISGHFNMKLEKSRW